MARVLPFFIKQKSSVGIELGSNSVKMVETIKARSGIRLLSYALIDAPDNTKGEPERDRRVLGELVRQALALCKMPAPRIHFSVAGYSVGFGRYRLPSMPEKEILPALMWKGKHDFPFPLNEAIVVYKKLGTVYSESGEQDVFVIAAHAGFVQDELSIFKHCNVHPLGITTVSSALAAVMRSAAAEIAEQTIAVLDLGARHTELAILSNGQLTYARFIASGSEDITLALTEPFMADGRQYRLSLAQAQQIKHDYGIPLGKTQEATPEGIPLGRIMVMMRPVLEKLVTDILRSFDFYKTQTRQQRIEKTYLCGGGAGLKNLPEFLSSSLGVPTVVLNPFGGIEYSEPLEQDEQLHQHRHRLAVALGLSIGKCRDANLLPPAPGGLATTNLRAYVPMLAAVVILLLGLSWYLDVRRSMVALTNELKKQQDVYAALQPSRERLLALKQERDSLKARLAQYPPLDVRQPALPEVCVALTHLLPETVKLTSLLFEGKKDMSASVAEPLAAEPALRLEGIIAGPERYHVYGMLKKITDALKDSPFFQHAVLESTQKTDEEPDSSLRFVIRAVLKKEG